MKILSLTAHSILDSRGVPTIEVSLNTEDGEVTASVPSGTSTGAHEAVEKRDVDGIGVEDACKGIEEVLAPALVGTEWESLTPIDATLCELDGTPNKSNLGGNALLAVSIACARAFAHAHAHTLPVWQYLAQEYKTTPGLPRLFVNVINGGAHVSVDAPLPFQEYILVPKKESVKHAYADVQTLFTALGTEIEKRSGTVVMGYEGGYALSGMTTLEEPLALLAGIVGEHADLALDCAANAFHKDNAYHLLGMSYTTDTLVAVYKKLHAGFPSLASIEDPFAESDVEGFVQLAKAIGKDVHIVADDLTVTNPDILSTMIAHNAGTALVIKPNQIGTLSEVFETVKKAHDAGWQCIASHRSGETHDTFIADLAVAIGALGLKAGAPSQDERRVKYQRLLEIEGEFEVS